MTAEAVWVIPPAPSARVTGAKTRNSARVLVEQYFSRRYRDEYLTIRHTLRKLHPEMTPGAHRARSFKILRHRHRLEWARAMMNALRIKQEELGYVDGRTTNGTAFKARPEYVKACPTCEAAKGQPCRQSTGRVASPAHKARFTAANRPYPTKKH